MSTFQGLAFSLHYRRMVLLAELENDVWNGAARKLQA
jgi:hypothetical protein